MLVCTKENLGSLNLMEIIVVQNSTNSKSSRFVAALPNNAFKETKRSLTKATLLIASIIGLAGCVGGQDDDEGDLSKGVSPTHIVQRLTAAPNSYPAALAVKVSTGDIEFNVAGQAYSGAGPLSLSATFPVGSLSKSMTATLAGVLVQEGRINWNSKITDVLPEFAGRMRSEYAAIELIDLLSHRGGIFPATSPEEISSLPRVTGNLTQQRLALTDWLLKRPPSSSPKQQSLYSNGGYIIAAAMLERTGSDAFESMLQNKVFGAMGKTVAFGTPGTANGEPWGHFQTGSGWQQISPREPSIQFPAYANPAGGVKLNADSFARYLQMHLRAYRGKLGEVLKPATAQKIHTVIGDGWSLGWQSGSDMDGRSINWHNGSDETSYYSLMAMSLSKNVASAVIVTGMGPNSEADVSRAVVELLK